MRKVNPPTRGVSNATSVIDQPGDVVPVEGMKNARIFDPDTDRPHVAQRPGLAKLFTKQLPGVPQGAAVIAKASSVSGYTRGSCDVLDDDAAQVENTVAPTGQAWLLDRQLALYDWYYMDVTGRGGPADNSVNACNWLPDGERFVYCSNFVDSTGNLVTRVELATAETVVWTITIEEPGIDRFVNSMAATDDYVFICTNQYVQVRSATDGSLIEQNDLGGWSRGAIACDVFTSGATTFLYVAFDGANNAGTLPNDGSGDITAGFYARCFRSGVMKFRVKADGTLVQLIWGDGLDSGDTYYEAAHGYARISELTGGAPHGCFIRAMRADADGNVIVGRTNQGWGPRSTFPPDGSVPYVTVMKIGVDGDLKWEVDTDSIKETGSAGTAHGNYYNDIPQGNPSRTTASIEAVTINPDGTRVYAAGTRTGAGATEGDNVYQLRGSDGLELWRLNLSGIIREAAAFTDPEDGQPFFAGDRNSDWDGADSTNALLWKVNSETGAVIASYDLGQASLSGLGVGVSTVDGNILLVSDKRT